MSVTVRKRKNLDGTTTLRLDIYHNGQRYFETLKNLKLDKPTNPIAREMNKDLLRQAEAIRTARAAELDAGNYGLVSDKGKRTLVTAWLNDYVTHYSKKDKRVMSAAITEFNQFLKDQRKGNITFSALTSNIMETFVDFLNDKHEGEGASTYYRRLKKAIRQAYKNRLMRENILDFVEKKPNAAAEKKDTLTTDEIKTLLDHPVQSAEVRKAVIFSLCTGLAWIDVKGLKWRQINFKDKKLKQSKRSKTGVPIITPLNDTAIKILGEAGSPDETVFDLPTANGANKTLKAWVKRAGIDKKITWHNLRHSAGTNLAFAGTDILTIAKILAHKSIRHTQRYIDASAEMKITATDKLNIEL